MTGPARVRRARRGRGGRRVRCTARTAAAGFYERAGCSAEGEAFDVPPSARTSS